MPDRKLRIIWVDCALIVAGLCAVTPFTVLAQDDLFAELRRCSLIDDGPARLECYDALSGRRSPAARLSQSSRIVVSRSIMISRFLLVVR